MRVLAVNRTAFKTDPHVERVVGMDRLHEFLRAADFVVLGCALTPETRGLIDAPALAAMKPTALLVNPARGPVIDEAALAAALTARKIGGAVIDVWWHYPHNVKDDAFLGTTKLKGLDNVLLSPHVAGWSTGTLARRARFVVAQLGRLARGEALQNVILVRD
jgi:phosphoglycerate dehydrogenase-like enzyme